MTQLAALRDKARARPLTAVATLGVVVFAVFVINANRGVAPYSGKNVATFLIVGASLGGIYAISACGLVVTYATTGIFNIAHGAIGCFLAFFYWELRVNQHWPAPLALFVVIFIAAPVMGVALDKLLMRRLRNASLVVQLMVTVGLMLAVMGVTLTFWQPTTGRSLPHFYEGTKGLKVVGVTITYHRMIVVALALVIALGLRTLLYKTRIGIAMRAVVDNRNLAGLTGVRPSVVSGASWALGCMTAAIAGILIAPETGLVVENLTFIVIIAFAAAAIAQLKSLPWAFGGGLVVGLTIGFVSVFVQFKQDYTYASEAIPAVILLIAVLFLPQARLETGKVRLTKRTERLTSPNEAIVAALALVGIVTAWANGWIPWFSGTHFGQRTPVWLGRGAGNLAIGLVMLSLVPLTGWAGQVSFANFAIAGFGAAMYAHFGGQHGHPIAILWVMLVCAPLGVVVALPALRLKGLYLALATMAFAQIADKILFRHPSILSQTEGGRLYDPLRLFGFRMSSDAADRKAFVIFLVIAFAVLFVGLVLLRQSRWARRWIAMADSPAASATIGINQIVTKVAVFALSGAIAGFAGCMLGLSIGSLRPDSFPLEAGLPLVLLIAVNGIGYPIAAFLAVMGLMSFPALQEVAGNPSWLTSLGLVGPGLAAITMAFRPEGSVFYAGRDLAGILPWRNDAREEKAIAVAQLKASDIRRDDINDLGLTRAFTTDKIAQLDRELRIADDLAAHPSLAVPTNGHGAGNGHAPSSNGKGGDRDALVVD